MIENSAETIVRVRVMAPGVPHDHGPDHLAVTRVWVIAVAEPGERQVPVTGIRRETPPRHRDRPRGVQDVVGLSAHVDATVPAWRLLSPARMKLEKPVSCVVALRVALLTAIIATLLSATGCGSDTPAGVDGSIAFDASSGAADARPGAADASPGDAAGPAEPDLVHKLLTHATSYQVQMAQTSGAGLDGAARSMAQSGYVVTAMVTNTAGYTIIGVKPQGSTTVYEAQMAQTSGSGLESAARGMAQSGYVVTAMVTNTAGYTIIGVKPQGSTTTYGAQMAQTSGSGLESAAQGMGQSGYAVTTMVTNTAGYTIIGVTPAGTTTSNTVQMTQTSGSGLESAAASMGQAGYVVTGLTTNSAGYTVLGVSL
ncbi:MAG: hypothetical protein K8W52_17390 [Deltaproteobacteria bacterium]|nr:hypothetical protein [Deltaproteobacteria bacterium]